MTDRISIENVRVTDKGVEMKQSAAGKDYATLTVMWSSSRKNRQTNETEYGPTRFMRVIVNGFKAGDIAANVSPGDRVNVEGSVECFEWQSQNGPREDWTIMADSVTLPVPRAQQGGYGQGNQPGVFQGQQSRGGFGGQQSQQQSNDPWNSAPQGGFGGDSDTPPF